MSNLNETDAKLLKLKELEAQLADKARQLERKELELIERERQLKRTSVSYDSSSKSKGARLAPSSLSLSQTARRLQEHSNSAAHKDTSSSARSTLTSSHTTTSTTATTTGGSKSSTSGARRRASSVNVVGTQLLGLSGSSTASPRRESVEERKPLKIKQVSKRTTFHDAAFSPRSVQVQESPNSLAGSPARDESQRTPHLLRRVGCSLPASADAFMVPDHGERFQVFESELRDGAPQLDSTGQPALRVQARLGVTSLSAEVARRSWCVVSVLSDGNTLDPSSCRPHQPYRRASMPHNNLQRKISRRALAAHDKLSTSPITQQRRRGSFADAQLGSSLQGSGDSPAPSEQGDSTPLSTTSMPLIDSGEYRPRLTDHARRTSSAVFATRIVDDVGMDEDDMSSGKSIDTTDMPSPSPVDDESSGFDELKMFDHELDIALHTVLVLDGGRSINSHGGAPLVRAAVVSLVDRLAKSAIDSQPRTLTILLCRAECSTLIDNVNIVTERQLIVDALHGVRFHGDANIAAGLEYASSLIRHSLATLLIALNASPPYPGRSGATAFHELHRASNARYSGVVHAASAHALRSSGVARRASEITPPCTPERHEFNPDQRRSSDPAGMAPLFVHAFSIGSRADTSLLRIWCQRPGLGQLHHATDAASLAALLACCASSVLMTHAHSCVVRITAERGVKLYDTVAPVPSRTRAGREVLLFIASISSNERRHIPLQMLIACCDDEPMPRQPLVTIAMSYLKTSDGYRRETVVERVHLPRHAVTGINLCQARMVRREMLRCLLVDGLQKAIYAADGGDLTTARLVMQAINERAADDIAFTPRSNRPSSESVVALAGDLVDPHSTWLGACYRDALLLFESLHEYKHTRHVANALLSSLASERNNGWRPSRATKAKNPYSQPYVNQSAAAASASLNGLLALFSQQTKKKSKRKHRRTPSSNRSGSVDHSDKDHS